jgi:hypothetical protein
MKRKLRVALHLLLALALVRCATQSNDSGSQTHWMNACQASSECGTGLACKCGVCTRTCSESAECGGLGRGATCFAAGSSATLSACGRAADTSLCLPTCGFGCGAHESCVDGACVVPRSTPSDGGGTGGASNDASADAAPVHPNGTGGTGGTGGTRSDAGGTHPVPTCEAPLPRPNPLAVCLPNGTPGWVGGNVIAVEQREVCSSDGGPLQGYRFTIKVAENLLDAGFPGGTWVFEIAPGYDLRSGQAPVLNPAPFRLGDNIAVDGDESLLTVYSRNLPVAYSTTKVPPANSYPPLLMTIGDVFCATHDPCGTVNHHYLDIDFSTGTGSDPPGATMGNPEWLVYNRDVTSVVSNGSCTDFNTIGFDVVAIKRPAQNTGDGG